MLEDHLFFGPTVLIILRGRLFIGIGIIFSKCEPVVNMFTLNKVTPLINADLAGETYLIQQYIIHFKI